MVHINGTSKPLEGQGADWTSGTRPRLKIKETHHLPSHYKRVYSPFNETQPLRAPKFTSYSFNSGTSSKVHRNSSWVRPAFHTSCSHLGDGRWVETTLAVSERKHSPEGLGLWVFAPPVRLPLSQGCQRKSREAWVTNGLITVQQGAWLAFFIFFYSFIEINLKCHTIHSLNMYNSRVFRTFADIYNHPSQFWSIFIPSKLNPEPINCCTERVWGWILSVWDDGGWRWGGKKMLDPSGPVYQQSLLTEQRFSINAAALGVWWIGWLDHGPKSGPQWAS